MTTNNSRIPDREFRAIAQWHPFLWRFWDREWLTVFLWAALGGAAAGFTRLLGWDNAFQAFLAAKYVPRDIRFDRPEVYTPYLVTTAVAILLALILGIPRLAARGLRSWWLGVTSGLALLSFLTTFVVLSFPALYLRDQLLRIGEILIGWFVVSFLLYLKSKAEAQGIITEDELRVSADLRSRSGTQVPESDDPIQSWEEDALGRAALVDSISVKLLISKAPVVAIFGEFGSGKTSLLNLLREHLADKAIVVSFSTWLPGSQETLTAYLLSDIANECSKLYVVPGLRKNAQRFAKAISQNVPLFKSIFEALPAATQKDDIENLKSALSRLPKRVVVLLDELDRMERDELITLLKVIRGISTLPNVNFVCAGERKAIIEAVKGKFNDENNRYFEKFFPVAVPIPDVRPEDLRKAGVERLVQTFERRDWFDNELQAEEFRRRVDSIWSDRIAPFCRNLRAIGLLANDVGVAAAPLRREVDAVDLTLIEMLRRFRPAVYRLVADNGVALTGGEPVLRGGSLLADNEKKTVEQKLVSDLNDLVPDADDRDEVKGLLGELFPMFPKLDGKSWMSRLRTAPQSAGERAKRISDAGIFPAYFRYELPAAIFSSVELNAMLRQIEHSDSATDGEQVFLDVLDSMEKGSLRRDDFLRKLSDAAKSMPLSVGLVLVQASMHASHRIAYDLFAGFSEAGHVLRLTLRIADKLEPKERIALLERCVDEASDDTMALRVLNTLTGHHDDYDLGISSGELYPAFARRMRKRYGRDVDAATVDLSTADPMAFDYWGSEKKKEIAAVDPEDRAIQHEFWIRYIGQSRSRLARAFRTFLLPAWIYQNDPAIAVENKVSVTDLKRLYETLPDDAGLTSEERHSLRVLQRFLNGEFKNGIGPEGIYNDDSWT